LPEFLGVTWDFWRYSRKKGVEIPQCEQKSRLETLKIRVDQCKSVASEKMSGSESRGELKFAVKFARIGAAS